MRENPAGSCRPYNSHVALEDFYCRWGGQEGGWLLLQEGGRGASGHKVPWGQVAADSHKWYLDRGEGNRRGACPCLPETDSSRIISAAIFHHPVLPQMWQPACLHRIPSHTSNMLRLCCLPSTLRGWVPVPCRRGRELQQKKVGVGKRTNN